MSSLSRSFEAVRVHPRLTAGLWSGWLVVLLAAAPVIKAATYTNLQTLWPFSSANATAFPYAAVLEGSDGMLYGTTYGGSPASDLGGVFRVDKSGNHFQVLHLFTADEGDTPSAPLIEATNGVLYGTTWLDGADGGGSVFKLNTDGTGFAVLHSFTFATNDGGNSVAGLLQASDGLLYGTAQSGGTGPAGGDGVVFRMDLAGSNFMVLHSFTDVDGSAPQGSLIEGTNGDLYGTALDGGTNENGVVFRMDKDGTNFSVVHYFLGGTSDGYGPSANLFSAANGRLYGTTVSGGQFSHGVVFVMDYNGGNYQVLHHFGSVPADGSDCYSGLVAGADGALYGTTYFGGTSSRGTVFQLSLDGSGYEVLVRFANTNGANPNALIAGTDGALYGTANAGGPLGRGSVFELSGSLPEYNVLNPPLSLGGTAWRISGHGTPNRAYTVQFSPSLNPPAWSSLGPATADTLGNWSLDDLTNPAARFFRTSFP